MQISHEEEKALLAGALLHGGVDRSLVDQALSRGADPEDKTVAEISLMVYFSDKFEEALQAGGETVQESVSEETHLVATNKDPHDFLFENRLTTWLLSRMRCTTTAMSTYA